MDVEWCNKAIIMKYLFKYVTKGPDFSKLYLQRIRGKGVPVGSDGIWSLTVVFWMLQLLLRCLPLRLAP